MKRTRILAAIMSVTMMSSFILPSVYAEETDAPMNVNDVTDHYGPEIDDFEVLEKLDIDTSVHYRSKYEDYDREVSIYLGIRKASDGLRKTHKGVVIPSMISFAVKSDVSEEEIFKILRKYFDDTSDDHILISQMKHSKLGKDVYGVSRSDSKDLIDYQLAKAVYEEVKAYADVEYFRYVPSYLNLQHCFAGDLEYSVDDYDTIAAYIKDNKLPFNVEITENELGKTKTIVFIENKKETEPLVLREEIYKATGIWGTTPVYYDEGIVNEGKTIDLTDNSDTDQNVTGKAGDIDLNGRIDVSDLTELSLALVGDKELTSEQKMAADVDGDGAVTLADLARLRQYLSKKIESLDSVSSPAPTPMPTVTPTSTPTTIDRPQIPDDYIWPINRENHTFDYATLSGKAYTKRCVHTFDESTLDEKTRNAFFESTVERTGLMASVKTVSGTSSEEMFLLKCGNEEGKYYVFLNESLTEEEAKKIYDQFGITEYTIPEPAALTEPEQPIPTPEPTVTPTSTPAYIEREPIPEGYIDPVNREDNPYNYATYKGNTYTKRCIHVFDETQFDEKTVNPFITKNRGGVMEFAKTVKGISSEIMFLVKCGNEEGRYFVFLNENLTEEEAKKIYDQFGITEYSTPEPLNITEPTPEQPIPTPVPTAVPTEG